MLAALSASSVANAQSVPAPAAPPAAEVSAAVDRIAAAFLARGRTPGLSVAVYRHGQMLMARGYGVAEIENEVPASADTVYKIGSISKQFTAALVMQAVERGEIGLDEPIQRYLPDYRTHGRRVTVRMLLNHTSGIPSFTNDPDFARIEQSSDLTPEQITEFFEDKPFEFEPGTDWHYNDGGYFLLGRILEQVTGTSFAELLNRRILTPLGLTHTYQCTDRAIIPRMARGYSPGPEPGRFEQARWISMGPPIGGGSLCSTITNLVRWTEALGGGSVVSASSYSIMTAPTRLPSGQVIAYGFGLAVRTAEGVRQIWHAGSIPGFESLEVSQPENGLIIVVLTNGTGSPITIVSEIARAATGRSPRPPQPVPLSEAELADYVGTYAPMRAGDASGRLVTAGENVQLQADFLGGANAGPAIPVGHDVFWYRGDPNRRLEFHRGPDGRVRELDWVLWDLPAIRMRKADE